MRLIDADAFKQFLVERIKPIPSKLSEIYPEIAHDDIEKRCEEEIQLWCKIIDMQPTIRE